MFLIRLSLVLVVLACITTSAFAKPNEGVKRDEDDDDDNFDFQQEDGLVGGSVLDLIKDQFKDIIIDIGFQVFKYIVRCLHHFKVRLFRRLAAYTLSDVFHVIFDGVSEFVAEDPVSPVFYATGTQAPRAIVTRPVVPPNHLNPELLSLFGVKK